MRKGIMMRLVLLLWLLAAGLATAPAFAQVYRWTDERGSVNYGSKPPPNARNVSVMREDEGRVSTVPGVPPELVSSQQERADQRRIDRLERDLDAQRRANRAQSGSAGGSSLEYQAWREQCLAERRVDCDDPNRGWVNSPGWVPGYPIYPVPPVARPPIVNRPVPPVQQQPWPQGNAVVPSPPQSPGPRISGRPGAAVPQ
jgi:hypothetical protein